MGMKRLLHVALAADDRYVRPLGVTMASVLCNRDGEDIRFHVLDDGISPAGRKRLRDEAESFGSSVSFLPVNAAVLDALDLRILADHHVTRAAYCRLLLPSLLPEDRCLYMDCDMICRSGLGALWDTDLGSCAVAAVRDIDEDVHCARLGLDRYFNSGLLLMDLAAMRREHLQERFLRFIAERADSIVMHDQDVLNVVLGERIRALDMTWNCQLNRTRKCRTSGFHALRRTANILHFIGRRKPWVRGCNAPCRREYWKYVQKTPWKEPFLPALLHALR